MGRVSTGTKGFTEPHFWEPLGDELVAELRAKKNKDDIYTTVRAQSLFLINSQQEQILWVIEQGKYFLDIKGTKAGLPKSLYQCFK